MATKKKVSLSIPERFYAISLLNEFKGGYDTLSYILKDSAEVGVSNEEKKEIEMSVDGNTIKWNSEKAIDKEIELHEEVVDYLKGKIDEKSKANELTLADQAVLTLREKLV